MSLYVNNTEAVSQSHIQVPSLTTTERDNLTGVADGYLIYNTTVDYFQQRRGGSWISIASPPSISTISPTSFTGGSGTTFTINGVGFDDGANVQFKGNDGTLYSSGTVTFVNSTQLTATNATDFTVANEPYSVIVTNGSGLSAASSTTIDAGGTPAWSTASGSLGTVLDGARSSASFTVVATEPDGQAITYSVVTGAIPTGMTLNTSTGVINGTPDAVSSNTTYNFTIRASDGINTADRAFSITVNAPVVVELTSGSGSWSVPAGISSVHAIVIGGGGGAGQNSGGGAGGLVEHTSYSVTPGGSVSYSIGGGGAQNARSVGQFFGGGDGGNTTFGSITANGGGGGGAQAAGGGYTGGSGGGGGGTGGGSTGGGGGGTNQGNSGGGVGYGNVGGAGSGTGQGPYGDGGGGGGGAGGPGRAPFYTPVAERSWGGTGFSSNITGSTVGYAGGGAGNYAVSFPSTYGYRGSPTSQGRTGSGAGAGRGSGGSTAAGGSIIIKY